MSARVTRFLPFAVVILLVAAAATGWWGWKQSRQNADNLAATGRLIAQNRELASRVEQLRHESDGLRARLGEPPMPAGEHRESRGRATYTDSSTHLEAVRMLGQVRDQLAAAKNSMAEMQEQILQLQADAEKAAEENKRLAVAEVELRDDLAASRRVIDAMETELKGKSDRVVQLEIAARRASEELKKSTDRSGGLTVLTRDLEDLNRRREVVLNGLLRRYRDLTDQLRAVALRLDNPQESARPLSLNLSQMQTAIQSAEDDMKQLASLNSQLSRLQQKLRN